jgi:hypothetical protein
VPDKVEVNILRGILRKVGLYAGTKSR